MAAKMTAQERKWQVQEDLATLKRASDINADRSRAAAVRKAAATEAAKLNSLVATGAKKGK